MTRLVQIQNGATRAVALVEEPRLHLLDGVKSIFQLAQEAVEAKIPLAVLVQKKATGEYLDYDPIYTGKSEWRLLPPIDHPAEPARCLVSGTGLTHLGSAKNRQAMHSAKESELTDSMKMFRLGRRRRQAGAGQNRRRARMVLQGLRQRFCARMANRWTCRRLREDGGEEGGNRRNLFHRRERGTPRRIGMAIGNEFSDHKFEKKNYLNLAGSKIRTCSLGPELVIDPEFQIRVRAR